MESEASSVVRHVLAYRGRLAKIIPSCILLYHFKFALMSGQRETLVIFSKTVVRVDKVSLYSIFAFLAGFWMVYALLLMI